VPFTAPLYRFVAMPGRAPTFDDNAVFVDRISA